MAFEMTRVQDALIPEAGGIITTAGAEIGAAIADDKTDWQRPWIQYGATAVTIGLPMYFIGTNRYTQFSKGMLYTALGMMVMNVGRAISQKTLKKPTQTKIADFAALVPQETVVMSHPQVQGALQPGTTNIGTSGNKHRRQEMVIY